MNKTSKPIPPLTKALRMVVGFTPEPVSFKLTKAEHELVNQIADRAMTMVDAIDYDKMTCYMDLAACHANGTPLRLEELLQADSFNFTHDVFGIARHMDRNTGKLKNHFLPRFSKPQNH